MKFVVLVFILFCSLDAHKVNLFITEQNSTLDIYSYFANGKPCKGCKLTIKDQEKVLLSDKLNHEGKYLYKPSVKNIQVTVDASGGHIVTKDVEVYNVSKESLKEHMKKEESSKVTNIFIGLFSILFIFLILKRIKK